MNNQDHIALDEHGFAHNWFPPFSNDKELLKARIDFFKNSGSKTIPYITTEYSAFIEKFEESLLNHQYIRITGLELFKHKDVITGCQNFLDQMIMTYGLDNLQVLENGYGYYNKLKPDLKRVDLDNIVGGKPLIIEYPFPSDREEHPQYNEILDKATNIGVEVYLDCAWLPIGWDLNLDLSRECIKGVAMSLSKCYGLHWSRIGVRWLKEQKQDTIRIENEHRMVSYANVMIGKYYLDRFPMDYLVTKYKKSYFELCNEYDLVPGKTIMNAYSREKKYNVGVAKLLLNKLNETNQGRN